jgi:hypothetical protein
MFVHVSGFRVLLLLQAYTSPIPSRILSVLGGLESGCGVVTFLG